MYRIFLLITSFILFFLPSLLSQGTSAISGKITDSETGNPLPGANISIHGTKLGAVSDINGNYIINGLPKGSCKIRITFIGYQEIVKTLTLVPGMLKMDFAMSPSLQEVSEVEIKGTRQDGVNMDTPMKMNLITSEFIRNVPNQNITAVLDNISGVNTSSTMSIFSNNTVVSMRGLSGNDQGRTLILFDGIPMNKSDQGSVNWNLVNTENVEKIEVTKGPGPAMYGSNAMGGVINIITKKPTKVVSGSATVNYGTYNTLGFRYFVAGKPFKNGFFYNLNGFYRRSDGYNSEIPEYMEEADTFFVNNYVREANIGVKTGYSFKKNHSVEIDADLFNDKRGRGTQIYEVDGSFETHGTYKITARYNGSSEKVSWNLNLYTNNENLERLNEYMSDGGYNLYMVKSQRTDRGINGRLNIFVNNHQNIITGVDFSNGSVSAQDIYYTSTDLISNSGTLNILAGYIQDEIKLSNEKFLINAGIRLNYAEFSNGSFLVEYPSYSIQYLTDYQDTLIPQHEWFEIDPKFSAQYRFNTTGRVYLSLARGFRAPVLDDLCRTGKKQQGFRIANPELKPEVITTFESGTDFRLFKVARLSLSLYYSSGKDFMCYVSTGDSVNMAYTIEPVYQRQNISQVNIYGGEIDFDVQMLKNINCFANYTYCHSTIGKYTDEGHSADKDLTGKYLTDVPMHKVNAGITWKNRIINTNLLWKYVGSRYINDLNTTDIYLNTDKYPAYNTLSIRFWKTFVKRLTVALNADNLFDVKYIDDHLQQSPGRIIMAEVTFTL